nr:hypothetical protein [Flavobacterium sp. ASV13]
MKKSKILIYCFFAVFMIVFFIVMTILNYNILVYIDPPLTPDGLHKIMPIKQILMAVIISVFLSIVVFVIFKIKVKR